MQLPYNRLRFEFIFSHLGDGVFYIFVFRVRTRIDLAKIKFCESNQLLPKCTFFPRRKLYWVCNKIKTNRNSFKITYIYIINDFSCLKNAKWVIIFFIEYNLFEIDECILFQKHIIYE